MASTPKFNKTNQGTGTGSATHHSDAPIAGAKVITREQPARSLTPSIGTQPGQMPSLSLTSSSRVGTGKAMHHSQAWDEKPTVVPTQDVKDLRANFTPKLTATRAKDIDDPEIARITRALRSKG
jgi:hypothetical protein